MSTFAPGSNNALSSTNIPGAFLEMAYLLNQAEKSISTVDNPVNNVTITFDLEASTAAVAATLPVIASSAANGTITIAAEDYIDSPITFGSGSTLKSPTYPGAFIEVAQLLSVSEASITTNPVNNITVSFDLEARTATIAASIPVTPTRSNQGGVEVVATDYL
ncbi:hypothetical protein, partial [Aliterella atlantica]|uniref:hypothetical protein n=1 Tax=Aliterella atlantica TaxID=1827278 RepID=UPI0005D2E2DB